MNCILYGSRCGEWGPAKLAQVEVAYCGHVYDEAEGDRTQYIPPGTRLEDLPEDWTCPDCGAYAFDFSLLED